MGIEGLESGAKVCMRDERVLKVQVKVRIRVLGSKNGGENPRKGLRSQMCERESKGPSSASGSPHEL